MMDKAANTLNKIKGLEKLYVNADQARALSKTLKLTGLKEIYILSAKGPDGRPMPSQPLTSQELAGLKKNNAKLKVIIRS
jgi:hypothetical protein